MAPPQNPPHGAPEPTLNTLKFYIDSATQDSAGLVVKALEGFSTIHLKDWWHAGVYVYDRLASIDDEINIVRHRLDEIGALLGNNLTAAVFDQHTLLRTQRPPAALPIELPGEYNNPKLKLMVIYAVVEFGKKRDAMSNAARALEECSREARGKFLM